LGVVWLGVFCTGEFWLDELWPAAPWARKLAAGTHKPTTPAIRKTENLTGRRITDQLTRPYRQGTTRGPPFGPGTPAICRVDFWIFTSDGLTNSAQLCPLWDRIRRSRFALLHLASPEQIAHRLKSFHGARQDPHGPLRAGHEWRSCMSAPSNGHAREDQPSPGQM
jgi:hypothetical protein